MYEIMRKGEKREFKCQDAEIPWLTWPILPVHQAWSTWPILLVHLTCSGQDVGLSRKQTINGCGIFQELVNMSSVCKERRFLMLTRHSEDWLSHVPRT